MSAEKFWMAFMDTGAPEMYLLYSKARKAEAYHVSDDQGTGASSHQLQ